MGFSHQDVERLIGLLDASQFDEMRLEMDGLKLQLRRNGAAPLEEMPPARATTPPAATPPAPPAPAAPQVPAAPMAGTPDAAVSQQGLDIRAPMLGTFYCAPKPGAPPFVTVGAQVTPDTVVAVIEVMKLMNSVPAGVAGEVVGILARDGELVEFDQPLMRVHAA